MYKYTVKVYVNGRYKETEIVYGYCECDIYEELNDIYKSCSNSVNYKIIERRRLYLR